MFKERGEEKGRDERTSRKTEKDNDRVSQRNKLGSEKGDSVPSKRHLPIQDPFSRREKTKISGKRAKEGMSG